jgi:hypothetical protein
MEQERGGRDIEAAYYYWKRRDESKPGSIPIPYVE